MWYDGESRGLKEFIGKTIKKVEKSPEGYWLRVTFADGSVVIGDCVGDCCSTTWIEGIDNPEALIDSEVIDAADVEMPDLGDMEGKDVVKYYGFKISTAKGTCVFDYRNESNGYYGGWIEWSGVAPKGVIWRHVVGEKDGN